MDKLLEAIRTKNGQKAIEWAKTPEWSTIEHFLVEGSMKLIKNYFNILVSKFIFQIKHLRQWLKNGIVVCVHF